ncbi:MAG: 2-methylcitrate dehydratase [Acidobacteria bacterium]|nr:MAG: 2-methylcitrate dehydratase [Acidobacteriota bacterium]
MNRRLFLFASGSLSLSPFVPQNSVAETDAGKDVTRTLARHIVSAKPSDLPAPVRKEAARTLLNWVGCSVGGSRHQTVGIAISALAPFSGPAQASILGRKERLDILHAALINGISSHVLDFDDTHSHNIIHPAGPVISAILALSEHRPVSGNDFVNALVLGVDVECRIGNSVYPKHYDAGWHITGTAGVFGAAAACGKLLALSELQMLWALGLAATQPVGLQEMFGSMTKSFHPGRAAQNGLTAALLASKNFTSSEQSLEAKYGWTNVVSTAHNYDDITKNLGESFEISKNTYKPFACGVVMHPTIDGCIQLRTENKLTADEIDHVELRVHPLVIQLTSKKSPQTGLEGKFSIYHAASVALVEGGGGIDQFSDRAVRDRTIAALRDRVSTVVDSSLHEDQVRITLTTKTGRRLEKFVEHAVGSLDHPMSDKDLEAKFTGLTTGILSTDRQRKLMDLCWTVDRLPESSAIAKAASL